MLRDSTCIIDVPGEPAFWLVSATTDHRTTVLLAELVDPNGGALACRVRFAPEHEDCKDVSMTFEVSGSDVTRLDAGDAIETLLQVLQHGRHLSTDRG